MSCLLLFGISVHTLSPTLESAVHLLLDTDANTIKTQLMESPSETYCFDKIIKPENYSNSLHGYLVNQTLEDSFNGFNSSILLTNSQSCDVNRLIQGDDLYEGLFPDLLLSLFNKKLKSSTLTTSVYELHGEVLRDLLSPQTGNLQLDFVDSDYVIKHLKRYHINNLQDISTVQNLVIYKLIIQNEQSTAIGNNSLSSRITIVKCASTNYPFMDRNKLILSEGFNFSNSVSALYDTVEKRDVQFCSGLLNRLLLEELGGNCKSRWLSVVDTNELDHMRTFWHFRWCQNINGLYNYPIQNDFNYKKIRARDFV
ncbi:hypothetical protein BC833DRAFT_562143 [Globomyces pollinis-pini]|nr:hypothetical protein BC833DRAFT_562143 [Globomyces pollinis-pini]